MCGGDNSSVEANGGDAVKLQDNLTVGLTLTDFDTLTPSRYVWKQQIFWYATFILYHFLNITVCKLISITIICSLSGGRRKPLGTRRRQLEWMTNFVLLVVSLFGISVGAGLLGFYKLHLLAFISIEFMVLPLVLLGKWLFKDVYTHELYYTMQYRTRMHYQISAMTEKLFVIHHV